MISVCMATYNGEKYIREQVDSILCQLGSSDEIVISDDGSSDSTLDILTSYGDPRIKIHHNMERKGVVGNFENALSNAVGDYIFLSDQDDVWLAGKVEKCIQRLQAVDLVMHDAIVVDQNKQEITASFFKQRNSGVGYWKNLVKNSYLGCCLAFRRNVLRYSLPIPQIAMHDIWIGLMANRKGSIALIEEPLILYRRHGNNASPTSENSDLTLYRKIAYRFNLFCKTIDR